MEDPDRPGDHACPHTLVTSIPDGIHKHKHTHNVNRWIEAYADVWIMPTVTTSALVGTGWVGGLSA